MCTKQDEDMEKCIQPPVSHAIAITTSVMVSGRLAAMSRMEVFLHQA